MIAFFVFGVLLVSFVGGQQNYAEQAKIPEVDQDCLNCICEGSSNCDLTSRCHNAGPDAYFCGPYVISWAYWHDGGRPGNTGRANDFETCLVNKTCAEQAVRGYMKKHGKDCDNDGYITCYDFARIHKMGPGACGVSSIENSDYWEKVVACYGTFDSYDTYDTSNIDARRKPLPQY